MWHGPCQTCAEIKTQLLRRQQWSRCVIQKIVLTCWNYSNNIMLFVACKEVVFDKGGFRLLSIDTMAKSFKLVWIPWLLSEEGNFKDFWEAIPNYLLDKYGGLNFLLWHNYSQSKWSVPLKITIMTWLFEYWTCWSFQESNNELIIWMSLVLSKIISKFTFTFEPELETNGSHQATD